MIIIDKVENISQLNMRVHCFILGQPLEGFTSIMLEYFHHCCYFLACFCAPERNIRRYFYTAVAESDSEFNEECIWLLLRHDNGY